MPPRCRVTFFDNRHQISRTLEVQAALPLVAAEAALELLILNHIEPDDLAPSVKVEIVKTTEQTISLSTIILAGNAPKTRVA
jgi:hypothetical protein